MQQDDQTAPAGGDERGSGAAQGHFAAEARARTAGGDPAPIDDVKRRLADRQHPHLTEEGIRARIADVSYIRDGTMTICRITMVNGFKVIGKTAPAHDDNYDQIVGERYAYEDAFRQLWPLEGYLLRDWLHQIEVQQTAPEAAGEAQGAA